MSKRFVFSVAPATSRIRRVLGSVQTEFGDTLTREQIHPAEALYSPAAVSLPGEAQKATGTMDGNRLEDILPNGEEGEFQHGPTIAYQLKDVLLANGAYYSPGHWKKIVDGPRHPFIVGTVPSYDRAQLVSDRHFELYFGHWLVDGLALELLAERIPLKSFALRPAKPRSHEPYYRDASDLNPVFIAAAHFKELQVYDDRGLNSGKRARFGELRNRIRRGASNERSTAPVYLTRGRTGTSRVIRDEDRLMEALSRRGFEIVDPVNNQPDVILPKLRNAPLVVSIEGSHQSHAILAMPPGSGLLSIQPQDRFLHSWKFYGDVVGIRSGFIVAEKSNDEYVVDLQRLLGTIDLMPI